METYIQMTCKEERATKQWRILSTVWTAEHDVIDMERRGRRGRRVFLLRRGKET